MAKKQEKEIEKWVTVNGARVPIFKDGSIGGPKALRDKVKAAEEAKNKAAKSKAFKQAAADYKAHKEGKKPIPSSFDDMTSQEREQWRKDTKKAAEAEQKKNTTDAYKKAMDSLKEGKPTIVPLGKVDSKAISAAKQAVYKAGDKAGKQYGVQVVQMTEPTKDGGRRVVGKGLQVVELKHTGTKSTETLLSNPGKWKKSEAQKDIAKNEDIKEKQIRQNKEQREEAKRQAEKAVTELQMYGKKKDGRPYSKKDAEAAVKSMTPQQVKKLADKRDERRAYQEKLTASSDMSLKKQYKTASFEEQKEIQAEMHSRGYFYRDGKWIDRFKARGYRQWGRGNDWD